MKELTAPFNNRPREESSSSCVLNSSKPTAYLQLSSSLTKDLPVTLPLPQALASELYATVKFLI